MNRSRTTTRLWTFLASRMLALVLAGPLLVSLVAATVTTGVGLATPASAAPFFFNTGAPDFRIATASRPESHRKIEIESADDFVLASQTRLLQATFTGLLFQGGPGEIREVVVEIYRVFPKDSDTTRTIHVPTRVNSPSDVAFEDRSSADGGLHFTVTVLNPHVEADNSVINGINPKPDQMTEGEGPVAGQEVRFDVVFDEPFDLPADHYFFVPQVRLQGKGGNFLWLSAPHPQFTGDLQMWIRNGDLDPDWLRVGTDIVGGTTFNGSFSLSGETQ
jgi:hypothetical protein